MLLSIKRAHEKKTFEENYKCPYALEVVENYIQILKTSESFFFIHAESRCYNRGCDTRIIDYATIIRKAQNQWYCC